MKRLRMKIDGKRETVVTPYLMSKNKRKLTPEQIRKLTEKPTTREGNELKVEKRKRRLSNWAGHGDAEAELEGD